MIKKLVAWILVSLLLISGSLAVSEYVHLKGDNSVTNEGLDDATFSWGGSASYVAGKIGNAFSFDGATDYISSASLNMSEGFTGSDDWSLALWVKPTTASNSKVLWVWATGGATRQSVESNAAEWWTYDGSAYKENFMPTGTAWTHLVFRYNNNRREVWVNGSLSTNSSVTGTFDATFLRFGTNRLASGGFLDASLDDIRLYDFALTQANIDYIYNSGTGTQATLSEDNVPITEMVGLTPIHPIITNNLQGWCNVTDLESQNVSFDYRWNKNGVLYSETLQTHYDFELNFTQMDMSGSGDVAYKDGRLYVVGDKYWVWEYLINGSLNTTFNTSGLAADRYEGIFWEESDSLWYVTNNKDDSVYILSNLSQAPTLLFALTNCTGWNATQPSDLVIVDDIIYAADTYSNEIFKYNKTGVCLGGYNVSSNIKVFGLSYNNGKFYVGDGGTFGSKRIYIYNDDFSATTWSDVLNYSNNYLAGLEITDNYLFAGDFNDHIRVYDREIIPLFTASSYSNPANLSSSNTNNGENWSFSCRGYDGFSYSEWVTSSSVAITNSYLNITFFNLQTNSLFNGTVNGYFIGLTAINFSTTNGSILFTELLPDTYTLVYSANGYEQNTYITSNLSQNVVLYLQNTTSTSSILLTVKDWFGNELQGAIITVQRWNNNAWITEQVVETDFQGRAEAYYILSTVYYNHVISYNGVNYVGIMNSDANKKLIYAEDVSSGINFNLDLIGGSDMITYLDVQGVGVNFTYTPINATYGRFRLNWYDSSGDSRLACLNVSKGSNQAFVCDSCANSSSGTVFCLVNASKSTYFYAKAIIDKQVVDSRIQLIGLSPGDISWGVTGYFVAFLICLVIYTVYLSSPTISLLLGTGAFVLLGLAGLIFKAISVMDLGVYLGLFVVTYLVATIKSNTGVNN